MCNVLTLPSMTFVRAIPQGSDCSLDDECKDPVQTETPSCNGELALLYYSRRISTAVLWC